MSAARTKKRVHVHARGWCWAAFPNRAPPWITYVYKFYWLLIDCTPINSTMTQSRRQADGLELYLCHQQQLSRGVCVLQASRSLRWHFITSLEILTTFPDCPEIALNTSTQPVRSKCECHAKSCNIWSWLDPIYLPTRKMTRRCALEMCAQVKEINLISLSSCPSAQWLMHT